MTHTYVLSGAVSMWVGVRPTSTFGVVGVAGALVRKTQNKFFI